MGLSRCFGIVISGLNSLRSSTLRRPHKTVKTTVQFRKPVPKSNTVKPTYNNISYNILVITMEGPVPIRIFSTVALYTYNNYWLWQWDFDGVTTLL